MADWTTRMATLTSNCVSRFGRPVVYTPANGWPINMQAVYDDPLFGEDSDLPSHIGLHFRASDFTTPPSDGDTVEVGLATYKLYGIVVTQSGEISAKLHKI